jgi:type IV secretory pathway VirB10-like protein
MDLGQAPATDPQGMAGWTGHVPQHDGRLFDAIVIGGVRRGGTPVVMTEAAGAGPVGHIAGGIAGQTNHATQPRSGRALDTRPTLEVEAGSLCQVRLSKPVHLPAVARPSRDTNPPGPTRWTEAIQPRGRGHWGPCLAR